MKSTRPSPAILVIILAGLLVNATQSFAAKPPNIVFIFSDDHAYQAISAYGSRINKTPNIDRIANAGMRFDRALVCNSICGPSRAAILTGKYSHLNGFYRNGNLFDGEQQTFPKLLQKVGYQTAIVGKWHLGSDPTGFDYWDVLLGQGPYYNPPMKTNKGGEPSVVQHTGYTTEIITAKTMDWLKNQRNADKPFMLMFQHKAPHRDWQPGPNELTLYDDRDIWEPPTLFDDYRSRGQAAKNNDMSISQTMTERDLKLTEPRGLTPEQLEKWNAAYGPKNAAFKKANLQGEDLIRWKYQRYIKDYIRTIAAVDKGVGTVLDYLDEAGLAENTVVIYNADQGFYLGEHGWFDKRWIYEESVRAPLLVRWPGVVKPGSVNTDLVANIDYAATFLEIAGAGVPNDLHGKSIVPILKGKTPKDWRTAFYYHYYEFPGAHSVAKHYGVVTKTNKLFYSYQLDEWELYDTDIDPLEMQNVANEEKYAAVRSELTQEVYNQQNRFGETDPHKPVPGDRPVRKKRPQGKTQIEKVLQFKDLKSEVSGKPDPSLKSFTVGARIVPDGDGVIIAQGGVSMGYSLFVRGGLPVFAIRSDGSLVEVAGTEKLVNAQSAHLAGVLNDRGLALLYVDGKKVGQAKSEFIQNIPSDGLSLGQDASSTVADHPESFPFNGTATDIRLYWGALDFKAIREWAMAH
ncbi:MAG: sulfatase-like hydrolase/transferase [Verrucomicrobiae bacterium]|nr:sulfatase-like hydrolase/transferase [Verrucomicrobiae bacterium]